MAAKILTSYDSQGMQQSHGTSSGQTLGTEDAEYFDPLTGHTTTAPSADDLATAVLNAGGFISKTVLQVKIQGGELQGQIRKAGGEEWDMLVVDLSQYPSQEQREQARRVIIDTLVNPDYVARKNQGGGRFQDVKVQGRRAVSAWGIHAQQTAGEHFHIYVHHHAINGKQVCPRASLKDNHIREQEVNALQKALRAAGLAELVGGILTPAASTSGTPQAQQAVMQAQAVAAANGQAPALPTPQPLSAIAPQAAATTFEKNAQEADAEAAKLLAAANDAAQRAQTLRQAATAIVQVEALRQRAEQSEKRVEQTAKEIEQLQENHHELARKHHELINDRAALALSVVNILGFGEEATDLPTAELESLATAAWEQEVKAKAAAQQEAEKQRQRGDDMTAQVVEEQNKRVEAEQQRDTSGAEAVEARRQRAEQEKRADDIAKQLSDERKSSDKMRAELSDERKSSDKMRAELSDERKSSDKMRAELSDERKSSDKMRADMMKQMQEQQAEFMKQLRQQQADFMTQLQTEQKEKSSLSAMVGKLSTELKELQEKLGQAMNTIKDMVSGAQAKAAAKKRTPAKPATPKTPK